MVCEFTAPNLLTSQIAYSPSHRKIAMPRLKGAAPDAESRKAIEERARQASQPAQAEQKGSWPFTARKDNSSDETEGQSNKDGSRQNSH